MIKAAPSLERRLHGLLDGKLDGYLHTDAVSHALWSTDASIYCREPPLELITRPGA